MVTLLCLLSHVCGDNYIQLTYVIMAKCYVKFYIQKLPVIINRSKYGCITEALNYNNTMNVITHNLQYVLVSSWTEYSILFWELKRSLFFNLKKHANTITALIYSLNMISLISVWPGKRDASICTLSEVSFFFPC